MEIDYFLDELEKFIYVCERSEFDYCGDEDTVFSFGVEKDEEVYYIDFDYFDNITLIVEGEYYKFSIGDYNRDKLKEEIVYKTSPEYLNYLKQKHIKENKEELKLNLELYKGKIEEIKKQLKELEL